MAGFWRWLWCHRNYVIIYLTPLIFLPLPIALPYPEVKCGYAIILMALYWCTECIPLAVTALMPVVLFPLMGIMEAGQVSIQYLKDTNMLFIGGLLVAIAVENWNLHKRIALGVLMLVGVRPALLMMGFMGVTAFLSMWISNTATTAMMLPIAQAVLAQLAATEAESDERELRGGTSNQAFELDEVTDNKQSVEDLNQSKRDEEIGIESALESRRKAREQKYLELSKGMSLSVCYSASIGGTATLTGTTPNLILKGQLDDIYPDNNDIINFASWFGFAFPNMLVMLVLSWLWLQFMYLGFNMKKSFGCGSKNEGDKEAYKVMQNEYKKLGRMKFAEGAVLTIFVLLVVLWFTREPGFMPGWASAVFKGGDFVTDGTVAIFMSSLFFIIPSKLPRFSCSGSNKNDNSGNSDRDSDSDSEGDSNEEDKKTKKAGKKLKAPAALLTWDVVHERMPWNIVLLLGGGFALASGSEASGLSKWLGESLAPLQQIPPFAISLLLCLLVGTFTECSSNTATTTLFLPILASMATTIKLHPLYVMLPCTVAASLAFMLPVATPPNAIAFSYGNLKVVDMAKAGCILNVIGILSINLGINTWGKAMFQLDTFPVWAYNTSKPGI
ncbi:solute carrier family 13 member 2 [Clupea harengus]|uniref:Solute carrier family 13 member 2 n=1 Tax=Clupea harengus TaxID=7950 RepID=A0A6P8FNF6_CLUHA|nr:solute carrier family 13 member 2 [Clupea harengus]XP_042564412.1 solute carrier family 13 member 2 [Clupea harengus]